MSKASLLVLCHSEKTKDEIQGFLWYTYKLQSRKHLNDWGLLRNGLMGSRGAQRSRVVPSNEPDFGVERDAEFFMDIVLYGVGECGNVFSGGSSEIGEYKWL